MTHLTTAPGTCPNCARVLFITRDGLWPRHINVGLSSWPLCVASDTVARGVRVRGVLGG